MTLGKWLVLLLLFGGLVAIILAEALPGDQMGLGLSGVSCVAVAMLGMLLYATEEEERNRERERLREREKAWREGRPG